MQVRVDGPARFEKTNPRAHMNRPHRAIYIRGAAESAAVRLVELGSLRGGWVDLGDSVHGVVDLLWLLINVREAGGMGLAGSSLE